ncbi:UPF0223 family protein [Alkalicoccus luteus]|uniref:UPF0223 family protein n=1 Tax=Alkalicoccus luteus TaxID=1237094 RepID=A0A969Q166_9BACI|nr:UPF0223 family protein [Alkalicoccus luteus]NJP39197.1 UPF0223 family protein [Alkalicoccus luteus]
MSDQVYFPISQNWSTEEVIDVVQFFEVVHQAYMKGASREEIMSAYRAFQQVVPSKSEEKQHFKEYEKQSGEIPFYVVRNAKQAKAGAIIRMN